MHLRLPLLLLSATYLCGSKDVLYKDTKSTPTMPVEIFQYEPLSTYLCVGAEQAEPNNIYAIAGATLFSGAIVNNLGPLAPAEVTLDNKKTDTNPICGQKINHLRLVARSNTPVPIVVTEKEPNIIYCVLNPTTLISTSSVHDATGADAPKIVSLANAGNVLFAAVPNNDGIFGAIGSGINVAHFEDVNGVPIFSPAQEAVPLDVTHNALKINHDLSSIANVIDMHWDTKLERMYIALETEAGDHPDAGTRAIAVGRLVTGTLLIDSFVPAAAIAKEKNQIVGGIGERTVVAMRKIRTMHTSTRLAYLIAASANTATSEIDIHALPLVDLRIPSSNNNKYQTGSTHGTLAKYDSQPEDRYFHDYPHQLLGRSFTAAATTSDDLLTADASAAAVGGGPLPIATSDGIHDLFVYRDSVYAVSLSGIFASQAIFDVMGRVKNWTAWQRVVSSSDQILAGALDVHDGFNGIARAPRFIYLTKNEIGDCSIKHGDWSTGTQHPLLKKIQDEFPESAGGILELKKFDDILIAHNGSKVAVIKNNELEIIPDDYISSIAPIITLELEDPTLIHDPLLFIAGSHGLRILSIYTHDTTIIENYRHIRHLQVDGKYLYVLTNKTFDRINFADIYNPESQHMDESRLSVKTLATPASLGMPNGSFADALVSHKLGILGTSFGLFRVANGCDITSEQQITWTHVNLPEPLEGDLGSIEQFLPITPNGKSNDVARNGMLMR